MIPHRCLPGSTSVALACLTNTDALEIPSVIHNQAAVALYQIINTQGAVLVKAFRLIYNVSKIFNAELTMCVVLLVGIHIKLTGH